MEAAKKLKAKLTIARQEAKDSKAAAVKAGADLKVLKTTSKQFEARVVEVEKDLQETIDKYEVLEEEKKKQDGLVSELTKAGEES